MFRRVSHVFSDKRWLDLNETRECQVLLHVEFYIALCRIGRVKFNKNYIYIYIEREREGNVQFSRVKSVADILRIANLIWALNIQSLTTRDREKEKEEGKKEKEKRKKREEKLGMYRSMSVVRMEGGE